MQRLLDPPHRVGEELQTTRNIEPVNRDYECHAPYVDAVGQRDPRVKLTHDLDDEADVREDESTAGFHVTVLLVAVKHFALLGKGKRIQGGISLRNVHLPSGLRLRVAHDALPVSESIGPTVILPAAVAGAFFDAGRAVAH